MKAVIIHGLLALFGLGFAYQTWSREPDAEEAPGAVTVAECREGDLRTLELESTTTRVTVEPQRQGDDALYWITTQKKPADAAKKPPDAGAAEPVKEDETLKPKRFLANAAFKDYLKRLAPLRAVQGLGELPKEKLADFGFDKVETKLKLQCGDAAGKAIELEAGAKTFGSGQRYVRDAKSKQAYLFGDEVVSDLQSAQFKFMQTDLHVFEPTEIEEVSVDVRGTKKRLLHRDRKLDDRATWVDAGAPDKKNELYDNWFSRLTRLRAREYLAPGVEPGADVKGGAGEQTLALRIDYKVDGKPDGKLELVRVQEGASAAKYYARTETTRGWVTVFDSAAKEVEQDAAMVVGLEEAPASKTAPKAAAPGGTETSTSVHGAPHGGAPVPGLPAGHPPMPKDPHAH
jgi:hypothetical protein